VLQALAVCEVRVRTVRTYDLVRPDLKDSGPPLDSQ
jgi:hypothetical protein